MPSLLLELFSEEIPARMQADAAVYILENVTRKLFEGISPPLKADINAKLFSTPRRIAMSLENLAVVQPDISQELKGPKVGAPEAALAGFLKKTGLTKEQLEERDGVYFASIHQKGKPTAELLKETIEKILAEFPWPKSMRWGSGETSWVRPLHSILCIFGGTVIPVEFAGVKAGNVTRGHRFLAPAEITIANADEYESKLEKAFVIADREKRKQKIAALAEKAAASKSLALKKDEGLLEEVTGLVEWPVVLAGKIDTHYMDLPQEVLVSEMRAHQKYFALLNKDSSLSDTFLITSNMETSDGGKAIIAGNERVLRARLADGRFFWDQDRKKPLTDWAKGLATVTYHAKLGSIADKVSRIEELALQLAEIVKADKKLVGQAAHLCKADLVTGMVGEFPELQGVMGRYYAVAAKENAAVADAIRDHYKPQGPSDSVPNNPVAVCVALADKLDTLISMFAIGEKPTGSKDPFALRRAALGVIRIILENNIRLPLRQCFAAVPAKTIALADAQEKLVAKTETALKAAAGHRVGKYLTVNETASEDLEDAVVPGLADMLYEFFIDRLKVQLKDSGIRHDVINAVTSDGDDDLVRIVARAKALQEFLGTDDGANLLAAYKRAANILAIEEKRDGISYTDFPSLVVATNEDMEFIQALTDTLPKAKTTLDTEKFTDALQMIASLRKPVDVFFEKVLINSDDKKIRKNRLCSLNGLRQILNMIANFALIEG